MTNDELIARYRTGHQNASICFRLFFLARLHFLALVTILYNSVSETRKYLNILITTASASASVAQPPPTPA